MYLYSSIKNQQLPQLSRQKMSLFLSNYSANLPEHFHFFTLLFELKLGIEIPAGKWQQIKVESEIQ